MIMGIIDRLQKKNKKLGTAPIFTINKNEIPLFIIILNIEITGSNFFGCIMYNKKKNTFSAGYRTRDDKTLDKRIHRMADKNGNEEMPYNPKVVQFMKDGLRFAFKGVAKTAGVKEIIEMEFKRSATTEEIMDEMKLSDMFEIKEKK